MAKRTRSRSDTAVNRFGVLENAFINNVVLVQAMGLCPILSAGVTLKNGVTLTVCMALVTIPLSFVMSSVGRKLSAWLRPVLYAVLASLILAGCSVGIQKYISPELFAKLYLFIPLIAVNSMMVRNVGLAGNLHWREDVGEAVGTTVGFGLVICILSALREIAVFGTVWGNPVSHAVSFPQADEPFVAFILLGLAAALLQHIRRRAAGHRTALKKEADKR